MYALFLEWVPHSWGCWIPGELRDVTVLLGKEMALTSHRSDVWTWEIFGYLIDIFTGESANHLNKCHSELGEDFRTTLSFLPKLPFHNSGDGSPPCTVLFWGSDLFMMYYYFAYRLSYMKCH